MNASKRTIGVLFGGCSTEYEVSLSSASAVIEHLDRDKYEVIMIGITREGHWYRYFGDVSDIQSNRWIEHTSCVTAILSPSKETKGIIEFYGTEFRVTPIDLIFPVLHGKNGEDGTMQGLIELSGLPFVGCGTLSSAICMDKVIAKTLVQAAGIEVAASITLLAGDSIAEAVVNTAELGFPLFVKPSKSGSSIGITKAYTKQELMNGIEDAFKHDDKVIIEQNVDGFEVGCAVLGNRHLITGAVDEIALTGEFFDHDEKYSLGTAAIHLPARLNADMANKVKDTALRIYRVLGCSGFARVDLFVTKDGNLLFNEVNTIPGFTAHSRYPNMMNHAGIAFPELLDQLIATADQEGQL
ncbi:D-alanine--D-serine ligase VanG [Paenibacillus sp. GSMTC-2017]|uniref:D-alanine--D-serine ligase VanG n=1 Tax=Paenibacillus sp. GSMTC-2017 TaxID=2794350 RepID=UPI0018D6EF99|nr:D-alanine--D-serine ligase VanG [Paenibacillus sp. GSMTC-2017]MBH5317539.1 D-alanine--D-serine ligase VanG [Paenibacillus sp. GSMTC-2017]